VRRGVPPGHHRLALPGGYIDVGETWQEAAVRELFEEVGLEQDPAGVRLYDTLSAPDGTLLVFGLLPAVEELPEVVANEETVGWEVLQKPRPLGFDLHTHVANRFFTEIVSGF